MREVQPPLRIHPTSEQRTVFLAGSIEMGAAVDWQKDLIDRVFTYHPDKLIHNPRRTDWDSSWEQSIDNPNFNDQVSWELDFIVAADIVVFYFDPNTKSPITLSELGLIVGLHLGARLCDAEVDQEVFVCCPEGFWRKGNVDIMCNRSDFRMCDTFEKLVEELAYV